MTYSRDAWVEVDLGAIAENVRALKGLTNAGTRFMAVVKADGYGHGAAQVAKAAVKAGADRLGIATIEEGIALREAGVRQPIHILAEPPASGAALIVEHDLIPTVCSHPFLVALSGAASSAGKTVRYHLKVDTGMNRIGVRAEEAAQFARAVDGLPGVAMEGVFTHFATADVPGDWEFQTQVERFDEAIAALRTEGAEGARKGFVHAANTAATVLHPDTHHAMVRCGIGVYGLHPSKATMPGVTLRPAMSVKAHVSYVKRIGIGEGVSYGFTYHAVGPTTIATLPLGYADGVHRVLSNEMRVLIGGVPCRQVGRVCMDQLMVEVPTRLDVRQGDEAVIVGRQGSAEITMDEVAEKAGTINYETACTFALRMERRFVR